MFPTPPKTIEVIPHADESSLNALSSLNEATASLEATLRSSQHALHEQHLARQALQDEVITLRECADVVPALEHEVLAQGARADRLEEAVGHLVTRNEALQVPSTQPDATRVRSWREVASRPPAAHAQCARCWRIFGSTRAARCRARRRCGVSPPAWPT